MDIKPMYDNTIRMNVTNINLAESKVVERKTDREIPNGIYSVIRWEKVRQLFTIFFNIALILTATILTILYATKMDVSWFAYSIPILIFLLSGWKLMNTLFERSRLKKDVQRYKEDIKLGIESTPPFISNMYRGLHLKQVSHNWLTITMLFYGGIATLLLWWLKDVNWWIFDFDKWINNMFANPSMMVWMFTSVLLIVSVAHIVFAIQRKKRILDINAYFGQELAPASEIEVVKQSKNKMYRRLFIISVMVVLVIPIVVRFVLKMLRGRK